MKRLFVATGAFLVTCAVAVALMGPSPASPAPSHAVQAAAPSSDAELVQAAPSATPVWGGPLSNGAPGPGSSPCVEVHYGDCGIRTPYNAGNVPYSPAPLRR